MKRGFLSLISLLLAILSISQDTITKADLNTASKVMGLQFAEPELDSMLGNVRSSR